jgi:hypothetical protein
MPPYMQEQCRQAGSTLALPRAAAGVRGGCSQQECRQPCGDARTAADSGPPHARLPRRWLGGDQEDVHEFFCALLELLQQEVLAAEAEATGNMCAPVWATLDPVTRNFSGTLLRSFTCRWAAG